MNKRFLSIIFTFVFATLLAGCFGTDPSAKNTDPTNPPKIISMIKSAGDPEVFNRATDPDDSTIISPPSDTMVVTPIRISAKSQIITAGDDGVPTIVADPLADQNLLGLASEDRYVLFSYQNKVAETDKAEFYQTVTTQNIDATGIVWYAGFPLNDYAGKLFYTDTLALGGTKLGLDYADFGYWALRLDTESTVDSLAALYYSPVLIFDTSNVLNVTGATGTKTFNGSMLGMYEQVNSGILNNIYGTSAITVNFTGATVTAAFQTWREDGSRFYDFNVASTPLTRASGTYYNGTATAISANGTAAGLVSPGAATASLFEGVLLGEPGTNNALETVGTIEAQFTNGDVLYANFGAK